MSVAGLSDEIIVQPLVFTEDQAQFQLSAIDGSVTSTSGTALQNSGNQLLSLTSLTEPLHVELMMTDGTINDGGDTEKQSHEPVRVCMPGKVSSKFCS